MLLFNAIALYTTLFNDVGWRHLKPPPKPWKCTLYYRQQAKYLPNKQSTTLKPSNTNFNSFYIYKSMQATIPIEINTLRLHFFFNECNASLAYQVSTLTRYTFFYKDFPYLEQLNQIQPQSIMKYCAILFWVEIFINIKKIIIFMSQWLCKRRWHKHIDDLMILYRHFNMSI